MSFIVELGIILSFTCQIFIYKIFIYIYKSVAKMSFTSLAVPVIVYINPSPNHGSIYYRAPNQVVTG